MMICATKKLYMPLCGTMPSKKFSTRFNPNYHCKSDICVSKHDCQKLGYCGFIPETVTCDNSKRNTNINFNDDHCIMTNYMEYNSFGLSNDSWNSSSYNQSSLHYDQSSYDSSSSSCDSSSSSCDSSSSSCDSSSSSCDF